MREFSKDFEQPVDLYRLLTECDIEFLKINDSRLVLLFRGEVVRVTTATDEDGNLKAIHGHVLETPRSSTDDWTAYIERLKTRLDRAAGQ